MFEEITAYKNFVVTNTICLCLDDVSCVMRDDSKDNVVIYLRGMPEPIVTRNVLMLDEKHEDGTCYTLYEYIKEYFICQDGIWKSQKFAYPF